MASFFQETNRRTDPRNQQGVSTVNAKYEVECTLDEGQIVGVSKNARAPREWEATKGVAGKCGPLTPYWQGLFTVPIGISTERSGDEKSATPNNIRPRSIVVAGSLGVPNVGNKIIKTGDHLIVGPTPDTYPRVGPTTRLAFYPVHPLVFSPGYEENLGLLLEGCGNNAAEFCDMYCPWFTRIPLYLARGLEGFNNEPLKTASATRTNAGDLDSKEDGRLNHPIQLEYLFIRGDDTDSAIDRMNRALRRYEHMCTWVCATAMSDAGLKQMVTVLFRG